MVMRGSSVFFSGPLGGEIFPPNNNKFHLFLGYSSHFLSPQKQFPPQNYISRKNPEGEIVRFIHVPSLWSEVGTGVASYHVAWYEARG